MRLRKLGIVAMEKITKMGLKMLEERFGGVVLMIDDTVLDKMWGKATVWVYRLYSSKHKRVIGGIDVVMLGAMVGKVRIPLRVAIYDRRVDGKSRMDIAMEMLKWAIEDIGIKPEAVAMDAWYASKKILKYLQEKEVRFMARIRKNRKVKLEGERKWVSVEDIGSAVPEEGMVVILRGVGPVRLFAFSPQTITNGGQGEMRFYISNDVDITREGIRELMRKRWQIEEMFRILKKVFSLDKFFVRTTESILGFLGLALIGYMLGEKLRLLKGITHYELQKLLRRRGRRALCYNPLFSI